MDQARWFIVCTVVVMMIFSLAFLQRLSRQTSENENELSGPGNVRVVLPSREVKKNPDPVNYSSLVDQNIPLIQPTENCFETPDETEARRRSIDFGIRIKGIVEAATLEKKDRGAGNNGGKG